MKRPRLPIYARVLLWFCVNLALLLVLLSEVKAIAKTSALLLVLGWLFMRAQFGLSLDWFLSGPTGARIESLAEDLTSQLRAVPESDWAQLLAQKESELGVQLALFGNDGELKVGPPLDPPPAVRARLIDKRTAADMPPPPRPNRKGAKAVLPRPPSGAPPKPRFMVRAEGNPSYWAGIHVTLAFGEGASRSPLSLVLASNSITGGGMFFDPWPWAGLVAGGLLLSALIWLPVIGGMTRAIRRVNEASKRIAAGTFSVRLPDQRADELGELATSVNSMAAQLGDYVNQQRRITADVAHELCSPIARMQMALGVIEQRGTPEQATYLKKVDAELQHMAKLVEEVMTFSKAETIPEREAPETFALMPLVQGIIARDGNGSEFTLEIPDSLTLHTLREALDRALGNVIRNAVRYAGKAGPIEISARRDSAGGVSIAIADQGPGVPKDTLHRLFEPFYRPEAARARHTGGSGLGLAIVKRCIEACNGTVTAALREPAGLVIELNVPS